MGVERLLPPQKIDGLSAAKENTSLAFLESRQTVKRYLAEYRTFLNTTHIIDDIVKRHTKSDKDNTTHHFTVSRPLKGEDDNYLNGKGNGVCNVDGDHGLAIGLRRKERTLWLAVTSFSRDGDSLSIEQLQGYTNSTPEDKEKQNEILLCYRWEFALVNLIYWWAVNMKVPSLSMYLIETKDNRLKMNRHETEQEGKSRAGLRYEVTPRRLGFRPDAARKRLILVLPTETSN